MTVDLAAHPLPYSLARDAARPCSLCLSTTSGTSTSGALQYTPNNGYAGTVTLSCSEQPAVTASLARPGQRRSLWTLALLLPFSLGLWMARRGVKVVPVLLCLTLLGGPGLLSGCGGKPTPQPVTYSFNGVAHDGVNTVTTPVVLTVQQGTCGSE